MASELVNVSDLGMKEEEFVFPAVTATSTPKRLPRRDTPIGTRFSVCSSRKR